MSNGTSPVQHRSIGETLLTRVAHTLMDLRGWLRPTKARPRAKVYLEFDEASDMFLARQELVNSFSRKMLVANTEWERTYGDDTIELDVYGISIVLTCKQRWLTPNGVDVGPLDARFGRRQPRIKR